MSELIDKLRDSRKNPQVLRLKLIEVRSTLPDVIIFVFESHEDIPVYEEWISRLDVRITYEPVPGSGKEQLLALQSVLESDNNLRNVYFFVDCDFDEPESLPNVFVLDAYSIENVLCDSTTVESILTDELRCAGKPAVRARILGAFRATLHDFYAHTAPLHEKLFIARREGLRVKSKPEHIREVLNVALSGANPRLDTVGDLVDVPIALPEDRLTRLREEFSSLPEVRRYRGKYVLQLVRLWLSQVTADRRSTTPTLFDEPVAKLPGAPDQLPLRRLASASPVPSGLLPFLSAM